MLEIVGNSAAWTAALYTATMIIGFAVTILSGQALYGHIKRGDATGVTKWALFGIFISWLGGTAWVRLWYSTYYGVSTYLESNLFWMLGHWFPTAGLFCAVFGGLVHVYWIGDGFNNFPVRRVIIVSVLASVSSFCMFFYVALGGVF